MTIIWNIQTSVALDGNPEPDLVHATGCKQPTLRFKTITSLIMERVENESWYPGHRLGFVPAPDNIWIRTTRWTENWFRLSTLKMEVICSSEMYDHIRTTRRYISENSNIHTCCCESLKFCTVLQWFHYKFVGQQKLSPKGTLPFNPIPFQTVDCIPFRVLKGYCTLEANQVRNSSPPPTQFSTLDKSFMSSLSAYTDGCKDELQGVLQTVGSVWHFGDTDGKWSRNEQYAAVRGKKGGMKRNAENKREC
jgi:hypothetical protein